MRDTQPSRTAMMVAYWRALGDLGVTTVPHFADPAASKLLDGVLWHWMLRRADRIAREPDGDAARGFRPWVDGIILRVAFIDAVIREQHAAQVVMLGAGLDTRAWRLDALRGARVFEVDHPATQNYKRKRAERLGPPIADLTYVPVDFARDDLQRRLEEAGFNAQTPAVWVWEGVTMYLDDVALRSTLDAVKRLSAPGSTLIAHYHEPGARARPSLVRKLLFSFLGEPQIGLRTRDAMQTEITRSGFHVIEDAGIGEQAARVGATSASHVRLHVSRIVVAR